MGVCLAVGIEQCAMSALSENESKAGSSINLNKGKTYPSQISIFWEYRNFGSTNLVVKIFPGGVFSVSSL